MCFTILSVFLYSNSHSFSQNSREDVRVSYEKFFSVLIVLTISCFDYNPQNEMFRRFRTKCSIFQNETYLRESFSLPINQIKKHRKNLLLRCFFIACLNEGGRCIPSQCHCKAVITAFYYAAEFVHGPSLRLYNIMSV